MKPFHEPLVKAWKDYVAGTIDAKTLKGFTSGFGIYQQRNDLTMMRIRRPGGIVTTEDFRKAANLMEKYEVPFAHITTRQAIQLHGVKAAQVPAALEDAESVEFRFRGGGGDTFRNTLVNSFAGLHADTVFDVLPYARKMSDFFYTFDTAYGLPRKLKIGFADRAADAQLARVQDLGFVAKIVDGKRCFETYLAGGIGFKARVGIKIFDALPAEECCRVAFALTRLFNDKGCRTNRMHARIRFLREDFGDEGLVKMLMEYYENSRATDPAIREEDLEDEDYPITRFAENAAPAPGFETWKALATTPLAEDRVGVRLFVPFGNFTVAEFRKFADVMDSFGAVRYQISPTQDLLLDVPESQLAGLYNVLAGELADRDFTMKSFVGHITTCIGFTICKSGVCDSPEFGRELAGELDRLVLPLDTPAKIAAAKKILEEVKICGCPNSCANPQAAEFGFVAKNAAAGRELVPFAGFAREPLALGAMKAAESKPIRAVAEAIVAKLLG